MSYEAENFAEAYGVKMAQTTECRLRECKVWGNSCRHRHRHQHLPDTVRREINSWLCTPNTYEEGRNVYIYRKHEDTLSHMLAMELRRTMSGCSGKVPTHMDDMFVLRCTFAGVVFICMNVVVVVRLHTQ